MQGSGSNSRVRQAKPRIAEEEESTATNMSLRGSLRQEVVAGMLKVRVR